MISTFVIESWASNLLEVITELFERLELQMKSTESHYLDNKKNDINIEILYTKISDLQSKLLNSERSEHLLQTKIKNNEETVLNSIKNSKMNTGETKKIIKNLEQQVQV